MKEINWNYISEHELLTEDFMEENASRLNWKVISRVQTLSELFIRKHIELVDMDKILQNQKLSLGFIETHKHRTDFWYYLSFNPYLTEEILETFSEKWRWDMLVDFVPLSESFIEKHQNKLDWTEWNSIFRKQKLSLSFVQKYEEQMDFFALSMNPFLTEDILTYYEEQLGWAHVSESVPLSFETVQTFIHRIDLEYLVNNKRISFTKEQWNHLKDLKQNVSA